MPPSAVEVLRLNARAARRALATVNSTTWVIIYAALLMQPQLCLWFSLGVVSSVGFGAGVHTGILFLWPRVIEVGMASANFSEAWCTCFPWVAAHTFGSAIGELPPFFMARAIVAHLQLEGSGVGADVYRWMLQKLQQHGTPMIVAFAAWPNALFDMCGLACGMMRYPLHRFLGAVILGKTGIRAPITTTVVLMAARGHELLPAGASHYIIDTLDPTSTSPASRLWSCFVLVLTAFMAWRCMLDIAAYEVQF